MKKYRFRKPAIIVISTLCFAILILGVAIINTSMNQVSLQIPDYEYVTDIILNEEMIGQVEIVATESVDKMTFLTAFLWILHGLIE